jgi:hypothetical protein
MTNDGKVDYKRGGAIMICTTVDNKLWNLAKENKISWNKALDLGLRLILSEIDPGLHPIPDCELKGKMLKFKDLLEEANKE